MEMQHILHNYYSLLNNIILFFTLCVVQQTTYFYIYFSFAFVDFAKLKKFSESTFSCLNTVEPLRIIIIFQLFSDFFGSFIIFFLICYIIYFRVELVTDRPNKKKRNFQRINKNEFK